MPALTRARHERFAVLVAKGEPAVKAYRAAGYQANSAAAAKNAAYRLLATDAIKARIVDLKAQIVVAHQQELATLVKREISERQSRVDALQDRWDRMRRVIEARSKDEALRQVPGGDTGLLTITKYKPETYFGTDPQTGEERRMTRLVPEYAVDTGLLAEIRAHEEQASRELGQWVERQDIHAQVQTVSATLADVLNLDELKALRRRFAQAEAAKAIAAPQQESGESRQGVPNAEPVSEEKP